MEPNINLFLSFSFCSILFLLHNPNPTSTCLFLYFISKLLYSKTPDFNPKKSYPELLLPLLVSVLQLHSSLFCIPKLHAKHRVALLLLPPVTNGASAWGWYGGLILSSRLRSGHLSVTGSTFSVVHPNPPLPILICSSSLTAAAAAAKEMVVTSGDGSLIGRWVDGSMPRFRSFLLIWVFQ